MRKIALVLTFAAAFFVVLGCGKKYTVLTDIPDAENMVFTPNGRLFVTGGKNVYEIKRRSDGGFYKVALYDGECNFCGIAQRGDYLYTVCTKTISLFIKRRYLLAARLTSSPRFQAIHTLSGMSVPNGIAFDSRGRLYINNTAVIGGKIVRITFSSPTQVAEQRTWRRWGVTSPNGMKIVGNTMYITDLGAVKRIAIRADGSAGPVSTIYSRFSVLDDLMLYNGDPVVADFVRGTVFYLNSNGNVELETAALTFTGPSSVVRGRGPLCSSGELMITEKGLLGNSSPALGNRLVRFVPGG